MMLLFTVTLSETLNLENCKDGTHELAKKYFYMNRKNILLKNIWFKDLINSHSHQNYMYIMVNKRVLGVCIIFFLYLFILLADADHVDEMMHLEKNGNCNASEIVWYQIVEETAETVVHQNGIIETGNNIVVSHGQDWDDLLKLFLQLAQSVGLSCFVAFLVK